MLFNYTISKEDETWLRDFLAPIEYDSKISGQKVNGDRIKIGPWAGPETAISNVLHEVCHFVEIDEARMRESGWGLIVPTQFLFGKMFNEFSTPKHIYREQRVWAYQLNLHYKYGIREDAYEFAKSAQWLGGFGWLLEEHRGKTDKQRLLSFAASIEKLAEDPKYSFDSFMLEFNRRKSLI